MDMKIHTTLLSLCIYTCVIIFQCRGIKVDVVGSAECLDCINKKQTFSGMRVGIACRNGGGGRLKIRSQGEVDGEGKFRVPLFQNGEQEGLLKEEECSLVLHNGGGDGGVLSQACEVRPKGGGYCNMVEAMAEGRHEVRLFGKLGFSSSSCTSDFFGSFPWNSPEHEMWKRKKKKPFLIFPFPPKCSKPTPLPTPPPPICDNPPQPPIFYASPPPPIKQEPPVRLSPPPPSPPVNKKPPVFLRPPPPAPPVNKKPPVFLRPPPPAYKNPPLFLPTPPPALKNPPMFFRPPPLFENPPLAFPPPSPPSFENPPIFETPFNPPPTPVIDYIPVPLVPKYLPPKFKKPCPPVFKGPEFPPPQNPAQPKFGFWFPVPP